MGQVFHPTQSFDTKVGEGHLHIEGSRPEWCISSTTYSRDTPFWLETLNISVIYKAVYGISDALVYLSASAQVQLICSHSRNSLPVIHTKKILCEEIFG